MTDRRTGSSSLGVLALIGVAVALTAALLVVVLVPISPCKLCQIRIAYDEQLLRENQVVIVGHQVTVVNAPAKILPPPPQPGCEDCSYGKVTLLRKWLAKRR